jgi:hypothetical protein
LCSRFFTAFPVAVVCIFSRFLNLQAQTQSAHQPEMLRDTRNRADYLIITPAEFAGEALQAHATWRSQTTWARKGLLTRVVTLEEINREFDDPATTTQRQAEAVRAFISYALQSWTKPAPSHVLLVGSTNKLPAYRVKVGIPLFTQPPFIFYEDSIPMDEWYVVNRHIEEFNTRPQAAIGRIPGRSTAEVARVLRKIRLFEEEGNTLGFNSSTQATAILDAEDNEIFDDNLFLLQSFLANNLRRPLSMTTVNYRYIATAPDARRQVVNAIGDGKPIVFYYGHGAPDEWSKYRILTTDDVSNSLARNDKPFMMITAGCSQNYDIPTRPSIVEAMMLLDSGGAVLTLASSGYSSLPENNAFIRLFFRELFTTEPNIDVGTAVLRAKGDLYVGGVPPQDNMIRRIALLGDPALVPFSRLITSAQSDERSFAPHATNAPSARIFPNPAYSAETFVRFHRDAAGETTMELVNALGQTVFTERYTHGAGEQTIAINASVLPAGMYTCRIRVGAERFNGTFTVVR